MLILAIDTATYSGGIAILNQDKVIASQVLNIKKTHSQRLLRDIDYLMKECEIEPPGIDAYAVSVGPGSFTGVRIGIACVKGLAYASGKPLVGIPTLKALALRSAEPGILLCPVMDARRGEIFGAAYRMDNQTRELTNVLPGRAEPLTRFLERIEEPSLFSGDGSITFRNQIRERLGKEASFAAPNRNLPGAVEVAMLGMERLIKGEQDSPARLKPFYLRAPDVRPQSP